MEKSGDQLHFHAFAEGEFADHDVEFFPDAEEIDEFVERGFELIGRDTVDGAEEIEGFDRG